MVIERAGAQDSSGCREESVLAPVKTSNEVNISRTLGRQKLAAER